MPSWKRVSENKRILLNLFRVKYPRKNFVDGFLFGESAAKCFFLRRNEFERCKFESSVLKKYRGNENLLGSEHLLSKLKVFFVLNDDEIRDDTLIYIGNHNFTKADWGFIDFKQSEMKGFN